MTSTDPADSGVRTVSVRPPDGARETVGVLQAAAAIAVLAALAAGLHGTTAERAEPAYPYQVLFEDQPEDMQRLYRELRSALEEMIRVRSDEGAWPDVKSLSEDLVAPFAPDPGRPFDVSWEDAEDGDYVNYLGRPVPGLGGPAFLLLIQENVIHPPGYTPNEFDRALDDGTTVHYGIWFHGDPESIPDFLAAPERAGWKQVVTGGDPSSGAS